ncbi:MAG: recombinase A [Candidatus Sericytochromatia bacterium]|nr:recombinase A [Candidatus Sericytochromatia bacterium]
MTLVARHPAVSGVSPARCFLPQAATTPTLDLATLQGRLTELRAGQGAHAWALRLVWQAQRVGEPAAWLAPGDRVFFPPDAAAGGIDLAALPVVRLAEPVARLRATDLLLRSGAFGLLVLDWEGAPAPSGHVVSRLVGLAQAHGTALVCLVGAAGWGPLVSARLEASWRREAPGRYRCEVRALKDRRAGPGWREEVVFDGPDGLC